MLERSTGSNSGTNWYAADMATMWTALANQDTTPHWQMLNGWQTSYELTWQHLSDVTRYKENLVAAWPPEKSKAAAAYVERLDTLITHLQATYDAAVANHSAFKATTTALADTRTKLKALYDEYVANQAKIEQHRQLLASTSGGLAGQAAKGSPPPPVSDARQQQLKWQAQSLMLGLSSEVSQAHTSITKPPLYDANLVVSDEDRRGDAYVPPAFPPIFQKDSDVGGSRTPPSGTPSHAGVHASPVVSHGPSGTAGQPGLVLGGASPSTVLNPPVIGSGGIAPPTTLPPGGVINPPIGLPGTPSGGTPIQGPTALPGGSIGAGGLGKSGTGIPTGGMRAMPPGGIIGGMTGAGLGQPGSTARPPQRINPVGGIINPAAGTGRPGAGGIGAGGPGGSRTGMTMGAMGARPAGRNADSEGPSRWDPDNPWQTAEGVPPVLLPSREQRVDPGPAIGLDR